MSSQPPVAAFAKPIDESYPTFGNNEFRAFVRKTKKDFYKLEEELNLKFDGEGPRWPRKITDDIENVINRIAHICVNGIMHVVLKEYHPGQRSCRIIKLSTCFGTSKTVHGM